MMGFKIELTAGTSVALRPSKVHGAPTAVNLATLLAEKPADRAKWLSANSDQKLNAKTADEVKRAATIDDLLVALESRSHVMPRRTQSLTEG